MAKSYRRTPRRPIKKAVKPSSRVPDQTVISLLEVQAIDPRILQRVREILKARGFAQYQH